MAEGLEELIKKEKTYHMPTYKRLPVTFVKGEGTKLWDAEGKEYLDFIAGLGVVNIGHCHPTLVKTVQAQVEELIHVTNLFYILPQLKLAEKLANISFGGKCFFSNSGAEANETAVKLVRRYANQNLGEGKYKVITAWRSFHGRTLKMLAATGQPEKQKPFEPLPPGFTHVPLNDIYALEQAIDRETCAVMLEPVQGEGGVWPCKISYLKQVRKLCTEKGILLILDEVQTGLGRTGEMFAYQNFGIEPDVMTLAKGLGSGIPIGVTIAKDEVACAFKAGDHGSTFGGGPVATVAALATIKVIEQEKLIENASVMGSYFNELLEELRGKNPAIKEVRGMGLLIGMELSKDVAYLVVEELLKKRVVANNIGTNILRFLPPLCVTKQEINHVVELLKEVLEKL